MGEKSAAGQAGSRSPEAQHPGTRCDPCCAQHGESGGEAHGARALSGQSERAGLMAPVRVVDDDRRWPDPGDLSSS